MSFHDGYKITYTSALMLKFYGGAVKWVTLYPNERIDKVLSENLKNPNFLYMKIYAYNMRTKKVGMQYYWANRDKEQFI